MLQACFVLFFFFNLFSIIILKKIQSAGSQSALEFNPEITAVVTWLVSALCMAPLGLSSSSHAGFRQPASPYTPYQPWGFGLDLILQNPINQGHITSNMADGAEGKSGQSLEKLLGPALDTVLHKWNRL